MIHFLYHKIRNKGTILDERSRTTFKGASVMVVASLIANITRLLLVMILSRYYSKEEFGIWATVTSIGAILATGDFGIINALRNKISALIVMGEYGNREAQQYFYSTFIFFLLFSSLLSILFFLFNNFIPLEYLFKTDSQFLKDQGRDIVVWIQILFFMNIPLSMGSVLFFSFQESKYVAYITIFQSLLPMLVIICLMFFEVSIVTLSVTYFVFNTLIAGVGTFFFIIKHRWFHYSFVFNDFYSKVRELFLIGIKFMGLQLSNSFLQNAGTIAASSFLGIGIAAQYNMVTKVFTFAFSIYQNIFNPIWAAYASAVSKNEWLWCKQMINRIMVISASLFIGFSVVMYFLGNWTLKILAGSQYIVSPVFFLLIGSIFLFMILVNSTTVILYATNKLNFVLLITGICSCIILPFSKYCSDLFGINGIAIASILVWSVLLGIMYFYSTEYVKNKCRNITKGGVLN